MRFLLDENLSPLVSSPLVAAGHDSIHARDLGLSGSPDQVVLERADHERRVVISSDTDFGQLLDESGRLGAVGLWRPAVPLLDPHLT